MRGVHIGNHCVIAAGSVVKVDVPDNSLYFNPTFTRGIIRLSNVLREYQNESVGNCSSIPG